MIYKAIAMNHQEVSEKVSSIQTVLPNFVQNSVLEQNIKDLSQKILMTMKEAENELFVTQAVFFDA